MPAVAAASVSEVAAALAGGQQRERGGEAGRVGVEAVGQQPRLEVARGAQRGRRVGLAQREAQLGAEAVAADGRRVGRVGQRAGPGLDREPEPRGVAGHAPQARRVVGEGAVVQDAQDARLEVLDRARDGAQLAVEAERHRVDGQVAAAEVLVERRGLDLGQRARAQVALARARGRGRSRSRRARRGRCRSGRGRWPSPPRRASGAVEVALDDEVDLARAAAEQQVADGAADDVDAVAGRRTRASARAPHGRARSASRASWGLRTPAFWPLPSTACSRASAAWVGCAGSCSGACSWSSPRAPLPRWSSRANRATSRTRTSSSPRSSSPPPCRRPSREGRSPSVRRRLLVADLRLHEAAHALAAAERRPAAAVRPGLGA